MNADMKSQHRDSHGTNANAFVEASRPNCFHWRSSAFIGGDKRLSYSTFRPAALITFCHFGISFLISAANSSGEVTTGSRPALAYRSATTGDFRTRAISALVLLTISRGVPPVKSKPYHTSNS